MLTSAEPSGQVWCARSQRTRSSPPLNRPIQWSVNIEKIGREARVSTIRSELHLAGCWRFIQFRQFILLPAVLQWVFSTLWRLKPGEPALCAHTHRLAAVLRTLFLISSFPTCSARQVKIKCRSVEPRKPFGESASGCATLRPTLLAEISESSRNFVPLRSHRQRSSNCLTITWRELANLPAGIRPAASRKLFGVLRSRGHNENV